MLFSKYAIHQSTEFIVFWEQNKLVDIFWGKNSIINDMTLNIVFCYDEYN